MKSIKINGYSIFMVFAVAYAICPVYFILPYISARDLLVYLLGLLCLYLGLLKSKFKYHVNSGNKKLIIAIFVWSIITVAIQLYHGELSYAVKQICIWVLVVAVGYNIINTKKRFLRTIDVLIWVFLIVGIFGIVEEFTQINIFDVLFNTTGAELNYNAVRLGVYRIISFTSHAISYCTFCMFGLAIVFYRQTIERKKIHVVTYCVICINAIFTLSRSSLFVIIACQIILLWLCGYYTFLKKMLKILVVVVIVGGGLALISESIRQVIITAWYIVLAIFDDSYADTLVSMGFTDNAGAIGTRLKLYGWVLEEVSPNYLLGKGRDAVFSVTVTDGSYSTTKTSIEVEWLQTLFRYGFIGLIAEIYYYALLMFSCLKRRWKKGADWEGKLSYPRMMFAVVICYVAESFAVSQNNELQVFVIMLMLLLSYMSNKGFEKKAM